MASAASNATYKRREDEQEWSEFTLHHSSNEFRSRFHDGFLTALRRTYRQLSSLLLPPIWVRPEVAPADTWDSGIGEGNNRSKSPEERWVSENGELNSRKEKGADQLAFKYR